MASLGEETYFLAQKRVAGQVLRVFRCYPGPWMVFGFVEGGAGEEPLLLSTGEGWGWCREERASAAVKRGEGEASRVAKRVCRCHNAFTVLVPFAFCRGVQAQLRTACGPGPNHAGQRVVRAHGQAQAAPGGVRSDHA